jgi:hypothetical protein
MRLGAVLVLLVVSFAAAGCGGGDDDDEAASTPTAAWADGFCTAITTWTTQLTNAVKPLRDLSKLSREKIEQAGSKIRTSSDAFASDLQALGRPETEAGDEAKDAVDGFVDTLNGELDEIDEAVEGVSGGTSIEDAITAVTASLTEVQKSFMSMLNTIRTGDASTELEAAFEDAESCAAIG